MKQYRPRVVLEHMHNISYIDWDPSVKGFLNLHIEDEFDNFLEFKYNLLKGLELHCGIHRP